MKKKTIAPLCIAAFILLACNNESKDSVEKADSTNSAIQDTAANNNMASIDEESSSFLVRVANSGMAETQMASTAQANATYQPVKDFAAMLYTDHTALNEQVKALAQQKGVVLPTAASEDKQKVVNDLKTKTGKDVDISFLSAGSSAIAFCASTLYKAVKAAAATL